MYDRNCDWRGYQKELTPEHIAKLFAPVSEKAAYQLLPWATCGRLVDGKIVNREVDLERLRALVAPLGIEIKGVDGVEFGGTHLLLCPDGYIRNVRNTTNLDYRLREIGAPESNLIAGRIVGYG
jgi:hypothetical protein